MAKLIDIIGKPLSGEWGTDDLDGTGIPVLRTTNFTNEGVVDYRDVVTRQITKKNLAEKMLCYGDIILEKSGGSDKQPVGRVIFFEGEENKYLFNNFTGLLRVKDTTKWMPKYVFYALFANYVMGGTLRYENKTTGLHNLQTDAYVAAVNIPDYSIEKQEEIVSCLDGVIGLMGKQRQQLAKLDELVKSRFVEMFGDPVQNSMGWPSKPLNDVCDGIGDGLHGTPEYNDNGGHPFINGNNLIDGKIVITPATKMVSEETYAKHLIDISPNAILISINGTLGKLAFYDGEQVMLGKSACYCNLKSSVNKVFVYGVMKSDAFVEFLDNSSTKSTIKNVGLRAIREYKLILPPVELQRQFAAFVEQVDKSKLAVQQALEKLETLKKSLMQQYFG